MNIINYDWLYPSLLTCDQVGGSSLLGCSNDKKMDSEDDIDF